MLSAICTILFVASIVGYFYLRGVGKTVPKKALITVLLILGFGILRPFDIIPAGNKGVMLTFGAVGNNELEPGFVFKMPIVQQLKILSIRPQQINYTVEVGPGGAISKDNQTIGATLTVFFVNKPDLIREVFKDYGEERLKNIITTSLVESFKGEIGQYAIFELPQKQDIIQRNTQAAIRGKMEAYPITITEIKITNYDWSDDFDKQIEETMKRAQEVKRKEQELLIAEQEAQKTVKIAEADKQAAITKAEGAKVSAQLMAEAKALEGEGIRKYNESVQRNMALEIQLRKLDIAKIQAERWNGQYVPTNNYGPIPLETGKLQPK